MDELGKDGAEMMSEGVASLGAQDESQELLDSSLRYHEALLQALVRPLLRALMSRPEGDAPPAEEIQLAVRRLALGFARTESDPESQGSTCSNFDSLGLSPQELDRTCQVLEACGLASPMEQSAAFRAAAGEAGSQKGLYTPLVLDHEGRRIYFERQFSNEMQLARAVGRYARMPQEAVSQQAQAALAAFQAYDARHGLQDEDHDRAVETALKHRLTVISGGPGTGKTTVVVRILACLLAENPDLMIAGAAPTGKASSNLADSIESAMQRMASGGDGLQKLCELLRKASPRCQTLHQWLSERTCGMLPSAEAPLPVDVLVVDECSMMDIGLASRLFASISPDRTRLILLGDKDQLAAVGPGSVFAALSDKRGALAPWICEFTRNHRFATGSRLYRLAKAVTPEDGGEGSWDSVAVILSKAVNSSEEGRKDNLIRWVKPRQGETRIGVSPELQQWLLTEYGVLLSKLRSPSGLPAADSPEAASFWKKISRVGALSSVHSGENGTNAINAFMELRAREAAGYPPGALHYPGRLVLVTRNVWPLGLANGDTAIELPDGKGGLAAFFGGGGKLLPVALLPDHESAFAITIHKSQGSSYHRLAVCLPDSGMERIGSRELLYTAVTRLADEGGEKGEMTVIASEAAVKSAVGRRVKRFSGLADRLGKLVAK